MYPKGMITWSLPHMVMSIDEVFESPQSVGLCPKEEPQNFNLVLSLGTCMSGITV